MLNVSFKLLLIKAAYYCIFNKFTLRAEFSVISSTLRSISIELSSRAITRHAFRCPGRSLRISRCLRRPLHSFRCPGRSLHNFRCPGRSLVLDVQINRSIVFRVQVVLSMSSILSSILKLSF